MRKKLIVTGLLGVVVILTGFVAVDSYVSANTISDFSSLYDWARSKGHTPPIPDIDPVAVYEKLKAGDFGFMDEKWFRIESLGTVYVSSKTKELKHLDLPIIARIYRYPNNAVYILSSNDGTNFVAEAALTAEPLVNETFEQLSAEEQRNWLMFAFWESRAVYEVTLKSEDNALDDLLTITRSAPASTEAVSMPLMMTMSVPAAHSNDLWLALEMDGGTNTLNVFAPDTLTNIEVFASADLCRGLWSRIATNVNSTGPTNPEYIA